MLSLNCPELDTYHLQCDELLSSFDYTHFTESFSALIHHTKEHFANEERLMKELHFQGYMEHFEEHQKILGEMSQFLAMAMQGNTLFAKNYIKNGVGDRLDLHIRNIDSQLAMFLKTQA
ncbi:bacteriohemerythrin [Sulfurospirillum multivorans]|uniref:Hemerythrin-like protein n=2 Tax=Sulfurospirillum multivorans TaxID=66821 RepID=A0AA86AN28_SULMK|nr:hemerythrin family protein [Sulfurospirillum multivorans]AHJ13681.1 hemerythrin-like protein [Sulfurospirillum multivorans DSM 12446]QEH07171.1 hemerythrin-like protein [Sulfurospirillum multivorans]